MIVVTEDDMGSECCLSFYTCALKIYDYYLLSDDIIIYVESVKESLQVYITKSKI